MITAVDPGFMVALNPADVSKEHQRFFRQQSLYFIDDQNNLFVYAANIWNLDTGGGDYGKLTIMNVMKKEYWQSDLVTELYEVFQY